MSEILGNTTEINNRVYNKPTFTITKNNKRINYFEYISSLENRDCNDALVRIVDKIDMEKIKQIIDEMPIISEIRKKFYKVMINERYEKILKYSYNKIK